MDTAGPDVLTFLMVEIARLTKADPATITADTSLVALGLQSIDAVILSGNAEDHFGVEIDPETIFQHETLRSFAEDIAARLRGRGN